MCSIAPILRESVLACQSGPDFTTRLVKGAVIAHKAQVRAVNNVQKFDDNVAQKVYCKYRSVVERYGLRCVGNCRDGTGLLRGSISYLYQPGETCSNQGLLRKVFHCKHGSYTHDGGSRNDTPNRRASDGKCLQSLNFIAGILHSLLQNYHLTVLILGSLCLGFELLLRLFK